MGLSRYFEKTIASSWLGLVGYPALRIQLKLESARKRPGGMIFENSGCSLERRKCVVREERRRGVSLTSKIG